MDEWTYKELVGLNTKIDDAIEALNGLITELASKGIIRKDGKDNKQ